MNEPGKTLRIEVKELDHLGIIDKSGLVDKLDRRVGAHPQEHVSCGRALKVMIPNGLGFLFASLYLFEEFFSGKATEHLNDERSGRVLEELFDVGLTELFVSVTDRAADR